MVLIELKKVSKSYLTEGGEVRANQLGLKTGAKLSLMTAQGSHAFSIAGVFYDYRTEGGAVWMDRHLFLKYWKDPRINGVRVYLKDPARIHQVFHTTY